MSVEVLRGSGRTEANARALAALRKALPDREYRAAEAWISTFFGFQQSWLLDTSPLSDLIKARQIGASHTIGGGCSVLWGLWGEDTGLVSVGEREAKDVLKKAEKHARVLERLGSKWASPIRCTETTLTLASGAVITSLPQTSGGRGTSGNIVLDEVAYYQWPEEVWDAASGATTHGYRMRALSTPNGVGNMFHDLVTNGKHRHHRVTVHDAIADGMKVDIADCWLKARNDPRIFAQLYECNFLDGEFQYIPTPMIERAVDHDPPMQVAGVHYAGIDVGLENDLTSLTVATRDTNGVLHERETITCKRTDWDRQQRIILASFETWKWKRISVDATGLGAVPAQQLQRLLGPRVEPVVFTLKSKEALATGLYQAFANARIRVLNEPSMLRDVASLKRIVTSNGHVTYDTPRTSEGHGDRCWSLALANYAAMPNVAGRGGGSATDDERFESSV